MFSLNSTHHGKHLTLLSPPHIMTVRCGHCKKLTPIWDTLASQLGKNSGILIAKMDNTENDLPSDTPFKVEGFPTLKLYKANTNTIVDYEGVYL